MRPRVPVDMGAVDAAGEIDSGDVDASVSADPEDEVGGCDCRTIRGVRDPIVWLLLLLPGLFRRRGSRFATLRAGSSGVLSDERPRRAPVVLGTVVAVVGATLSGVQARETETASGPRRSKQKGPVNTHGGPHDSLLRAGVQGPDNPSAKVLELLERHGVFRVGGVLVGSHAFAALGPMLGVAWGAAWKTADIDIAKTPRLRVAVSERADLPADLLQSELPFRGVPALDRRSPSTSFSVRGHPLSVDVLTPLVGPPVDGPIFLSGLNVAAQPLRFLDYLIEDHQPAALVGRSGILVNLPSPARYALHKLVVARERHVGEQVKARKDIAQAAQLIELLAEIRPGDLVLAWEALCARGPRWMKRVDASRTLLPTETDALLTEVTG